MKHYLSLLSKYRNSIMGVAILWIMSSHTLTSMNCILFNAGYAGVDLFLFLSGFGLVFSLSRNNELNLYYKKRFCRIFPEFWTFLLIDFIICHSFTASSFRDLLINATTLGYWIPGCSYKLWYISCIILIYILFPFYHKGAASNSRFPIKCLAVSFIPILLYALIMVFAFDNENRGETLILSIARIPVFIIGTMCGYLANSGQDFPVKRSNKLILFGLFVSAVFCLLYSRRFLPEYQWTCALSILPFLAIAPTMCIVLAVIFDKCPEWIPELLSSIGKISLELYLVHEAIYHHLIDFMTDRHGIAIALFAIWLLSICSAVLLYQFNNKVMQKPLKKLLF